MSRGGLPCFERFLPGFQARLTGPAGVAAAGQICLLPGRCYLGWAGGPGQGPGRGPGRAAAPQASLMLPVRDPTMGAAGAGYVVVGAPRCGLV